MQKSHRLAALTATALIGGLALSACSGDATPTSDDKTLIVYSGRDASLIGPLIEKFEAASGITVKVRYGGTTAIAAQILEEGDRTPAQVFISQDAGALGAVSAAGRLVALPEDITSAVNADYTSKDGTWVGLTGRSRVVVYDSNTYSADQIPGDVLKFTEPQWKSKVGIVPGNASFQAHVTALRATIGEEATKNWLTGLIANDAQIFAKNGEVLTAVNNGAVELGLINHYYWARSEGDPTAQRAQLKFGDAGSISALVNVTGAAILKEAEGNSAAVEFVKFLVSEEAQKYFAEETYEYPLIANVAGPAGVPALSELGGPDIDLAKLADLEGTVALLTEVGLL